MRQSTGMQLWEAARYLLDLEQRPDAPANPPPRCFEGFLMPSPQATPPPHPQPDRTRTKPIEAPPTVSAVAFFFEQCQVQLERQMKDVDAMDNKAVAIATAGTLLLAIVPGTRFAAHDSTSTGLSTGALAVLVASMLSYLGVLIAIWFALTTSRFHFPPAPRDIYQDYLRIDPALSKLTIAMDMMAKYEVNKDQMNRKQRATLIGLVLVAVESLVLVGGLLVH